MAKQYSCEFEELKDLLSHIPQWLKTNDDKKAVKLTITNCMQMMDYSADPFYFLEIDYIDASEIDKFEFNHFDCWSIYPMYAYERLQKCIKQQ